MAKKSEAPQKEVAKEPAKAEGGKERVPDWGAKGFLGLGQLLN